MNIFAFSSILVIVSNLAIAILVSQKGKNRKISIIWISLCVVATAWGIGSYKYSTTLSREVFLSWFRIANIGVVLGPAIFFHFTLELLKLRKKYLLIAAYLFSGLFLFLVFFASDYFLGEGRWVFNQFYWHDWPSNKNPIYLFFYISFYWFLLLYSFLLLLGHFKSSTGEKRNQLKYFILGTLVAWLGPHGMFLLNFGFNVYPFSNFALALYPLIIGYAIIRHHLMDIEFVIKKGLVYSVLAAIITACYLIFVIGIGKLFQGLVGYQSFAVNLLAVFAIALTFNPLRDRIQHFLDKKFFKGTLETLVQERERLREQLFQKEKLAYMGTLASSVVHEIRNPLTAIKTFVEYFPEKANDPEYKDKFQKLIPKELGRIDNVVNQLLSLAKPAHPSLGKVNIINTIDATLSLLEENLKLKKINLKKDYSVNEAIVEGDDEQLRQVFLNLFLNSVQAMDDGGVLSISVDSREDKFVNISVKDTGSGISVEDQKKLFTPFFTTKKEGIGLGLVIIKEIIDNHKGTLSVDSEVGKGTRFLINLPTAKQEQRY